MEQRLVRLKKVRRRGRSGRVRYDWTLRWFQTDGVERSEKIGDVASMSRREADAIRRRRETAFASGELPRDRPKPITLEQFSEYHREAVSMERKAGTLVKYDRALRRLIVVLGSNHTVRDLCGLALATISVGGCGSGLSGSSSLTRTSAALEQAEEFH